MSAGPPLHMNPALIPKLSPHFSVFTNHRPKGPEEVILTGTFDNWSKSLFLVKQANGSFELTVPLPSSSGKLLYKYVVDGEWKLSPDDRIEKDESGIENNVLEESDFTTASKGSAIPEAGGLAYTPAAQGEAKATVMPTSEPKQHSVAGEPGIHVPTDPEALAAFSTVRDVDAKALNERELTPEEKKKQKKKVKRSQYKAKKKNKAAAAGAVNNGEGTTEDTSEFNSTPEPDAATKAVEEETAKDKKAEEVLGAAAVGTLKAGAATTLVSRVPVDDEAPRGHTLRTQKLHQCLSLLALKLPLSLLQ